MNESPHSDTGLPGLIFQAIDADPGGSIPFADFMHMALYDAESGYYARSDPPRQIGRSGDFYTSVSVGKCFGSLLARAIHDQWSTGIGSSAAPFTIVEQGAHDGQLALDILESVADFSTDLYHRLRYLIIEESDSRREFLEKQFHRSGFGEKIGTVSSASEIRVPDGIFLCNELIDAFPVNRIRMVDGVWKEMRVAGENGRFFWKERAIHPNSPLFAEAGKIRDGFSNGYTTEICPCLEEWSEEIAPIFEKGVWWVIDYGLEAEDYFSPERREGTLRCYRNHQATDNPFDAVGETDITAHVNFSHLTQAMESAGLKHQSLTDQHDFLTRVAAPWLKEMEECETTQEPANRKLLRQFQTLTHPGMLGRVFKVAEYRRGL